jgi:cytochrome c oxidase subunit 2
MKKKFVLMSLFVSMAALFSHTVHGQEAQKIEVTAKRFGFEPSEITLKKGQPVTLVLHSQDIAHGLRFRELNVDTKVDKGGVSEVSFVPQKAGEFVGHCSVFCGVGHGKMTLTLHVAE